MRALYDGDTLLWRFGYRDSPGLAINALKEYLSSMEATHGFTDRTIFLGYPDKSNYRYKAYPEYKASRKDQPKPPSYEVLREYVLTHLNPIIIRGAEVDDALGIEQCCTEEDTIILTNDKDLDMIPGWHIDMDYNRASTTKDGKTYRKKTYKKRPKYFIKDPGFLSLRKANGRNVLIGGGKLWFCAQMLMGDSADDIKGISKLGFVAGGFGPVKAYNTLKDCKTFDEAIRVCYNKYKEVVPEAEKWFKINTKLLWIKRKKGKEDVLPGDLFN